MKIHSLKISNVVSFKYFEDIDEATHVNFNDTLNIFIGENGSGKSTILEIITFILRRVIFLPYIVHISEERISKTPFDQLRNAINLLQGDVVEGFKLDPNWNSEDLLQQIKISIRLGEVDKENLRYIHRNYARLKEVADQYSGFDLVDIVDFRDDIDFVVNIKGTPGRFSISHPSDNNAWCYLRDYNLYNHLIDFHNFFSNEEKLSRLGESFVVLGGYRNYSTISNTTSLSTDVRHQLRGLYKNDYRKGVRSSDTGEPSIFSLVRLVIASEHARVLRRSGEDEAGRFHSPTLEMINENLQLINLKCQITLADISTWSYSFNFVDTIHNRVITDIDDLSAGQKSLLHLIFEAYGRGEYRGGLVIIDEPELHLHFQLQAAYLRIMEDINKKANGQYVLVTHSDSLVSYRTIGAVSRLARDAKGDTLIFKPIELDSTKKQLIKVLDNTRSTYALFARRVILVEGDTDRYLYQKIIEKQYALNASDTTVLDIGGKTNYLSWRKLFTSYGMKVSFVGDFDNIFSLPINGATLVDSHIGRDARIIATQKKLDNLDPREEQRIKDAYLAFIEASNLPSQINYGKFLSFSSMVKKVGKSISKEYIDETFALDDAIETKIEGAYDEGIYILKRGSIENYTCTKEHDMASMMVFCDSQLDTWLRCGSVESSEVISIFDKIFDKSHL